MYLYFCDDWSSDSTRRFNYRAAVTAVAIFAIVIDNWGQPEQRLYSSCGMQATGATVVRRGSSASAIAVPAVSAVPAVAIYH
jgi:hypothetical protein